MLIFQFSVFEVKVISGMDYDWQGMLTPLATHHNAVLRRQGAALMIDIGPKRQQWITLVQQAKLERSSSVSRLVHTSSPFSSVRTVRVNLLGARADRTL